VAEEASVSIRAVEPEPHARRGRPVTKAEFQIPPGDFLVYHFRTRDHSRCDRSGKFLDGTNQSGSLFESLPEAETFAIAEAKFSPAVGAGIFDHSWQVVAEFLPDDFIQKRDKANTPGRLFLLAGAMLIAGSAFLWMEIRSGWTVMFGFLIGSRLLFPGFFKLGTGIQRLKRHKS
jgi:hypothetical protein